MQEHYDNLPSGGLPSSEPIDGGSTMAEAQPFPFWTFADVLIYIGLALPCFSITFYAAAHAIAFFAGDIDSKGLRLLVPQFIGYMAAAVPLWLLFHMKHDRSLREAMQWRLSVPDGFRSLQLGFALAVSVLLLGVLLRTPPMETPMEELLNDPLSLALAAVLGVTLGPLFEECFFRGLLQPLTIKAAGVAMGILIPAALFGALHAPQYGWSWRHVLLITVAGSGFGWMRHRTQSVATATAMHCSYNLILFTGFILGRNI